MALSLFTGKSGKVTSGTEILHVINWTCNVTRDIEDATAMGSGVAWRSKVMGIMDWTATVECYQKAGSTYHLEPGTAAASLVLNQDATHALTGDAICTSATVNNPSDGMCTITYEFQGVGELEWA